MKMRSLGGKESTFCDILHNAVLQVCREKYWADSPDWEVDGVICISVPHSQEQHVVKIHQKFPSDSNKHFDDRCYECDRKPKDSLSTNETSDRHFSASVEEEDSSYRNVSVIDLEHASAQPNPAETCGRGTISPNLTSPVREHDQNSQKNFYASPDLSGFGPNVHRQRSEQLKNSNSQSHSKTNNRSKDQEHSSSFTSHPRETTPPRKKAKPAPEEYIVVKAEPDDDEDFALHMECIDEKISENSTDIKDENTQRDLAAETQEDINFLLNVDGSSASHQYNSGDRSWPQRLPTSTVTSQMNTSLSSMAGQGTQGFSNLNLLTHGVDVEDGTMRLTTRVQHPHIIAGQTDSNTPEQRSIPRPSGQDSAAASNTIDDATFKAMMMIKAEKFDPDELYSIPCTDEPSTGDGDYKYNMETGDYSDHNFHSAPAPYNIEDQWNSSRGTSVNKGKKKAKYRRREYTCDFCGKVYLHRCRLRDHISEYHSKENVESPTICKEELQLSTTPLNTKSQLERLLTEDLLVGKKGKTESKKVKRKLKSCLSRKKTRRRSKQGKAAVQELTGDPTTNESQQDQIRLEVLSYQNDEEICHRQVVLSGMLGDHQVDDSSKSNNTDSGMVKQKVSTITTDTSGNTTDDANIQFWCKCGKSFTSLSTFVLHKFPCEAVLKTKEK